MHGKAVTVGAQEAKNHFAKILEKVTDGTPYIITKRGKPVVKMVPVEEGQTISFRELAVKAEAVRKRIMAETGTIDVRGYINEGRK
jgi:prevent-host-death family protein